jgi:hypothetical protein
VPATATRGGYEPEPEIVEQVMDDDSFRRWMTEMVFGLTHEGAGGRAVV